MKCCEDFLMCIVDGGLVLPRGGKVEASAFF